MSYHKMTTISGFDTHERAPRSEGADGGYFSVTEPWLKKHLHVTVRRGHWSLQSCLKYMAARGIVRGSIEHKTSDASGKGYGSFDARWSVLDGMAAAEPVTPEMDEAFAEMDANDVHELS